MSQSEAKPQQSDVHSTAFLVLAVWLWLIMDLWIHPASRLTVP